MHAARHYCSDHTGLAKGPSLMPLLLPCMAFSSSLCHLAISQHPQSHHIEQQSPCSRMQCIVAGDDCVFNQKVSPALPLQSNWSRVGARLENCSWLKWGGFRVPSQAEVPESPLLFSLEIPIPSFYPSPNPSLQRGKPQQQQTIVLSQRSLSHMN